MEKLRKLKRLKSEKNVNVSATAIAVLYFIFL